MLAVTEEAATAIGGIITARELPDEAGVRLTLETVAADGGGERELRMAIVEAPRSDDEVLEGVPVFLEPEAAAALEDKLLDADVSGDQVQFAVRQQS